MNRVLLRWHLGLGDAVVQNGLVRALKRSGMSLRLPARRRFARSVAWMFRDLPDLEVFPVKDADACDRVVARARRRGEPVLGLGFHDDGGLQDRRHWDEEFYRQAGVPFAERWEGFRFKEEPGLSIVPPEGRYAFCHERGRYPIDAALLPAMPILKPTRERADNIFAWLECIRNATEIHCIDSSFLNLVESIPTPKVRRLVFHAYAKGTHGPALRKPWEVLHSEAGGAREARG